jgi:hypothetical protein
MDHKKIVLIELTAVTGSVHQRGEQEGRKIPGVSVAILASADSVM